MLHMWRPAWYSSVMPLAPRISRARRAHSRATQILFLLPIEICAGVARPSSLRRPSRSARSCALVISLAIQTSFSCWIWKAAIGFPKTTRSFAYERASSIAPLHGARAQRRRIAPGIRLRQPEAADRLTTGHGREPALLLILRTEGVDGIHAQGPLDRGERS